MTEKRPDLIVTGHALERTEERWPELVDGLTDKEVARIIQGEVNDALVAGRYGSFCPIELANNDVERWGAKRGGWYCWLEDKSRGYFCVEEDNATTVITVLVGEDRETAKRKLQRRR